MGTASAIFQAAAVVAGFVAAYLWFEAARIEVPLDVSVSGFVFDGHPALQVDGIDALGKALRAQGNGNKRAAIWTGLSVGLQAIGILLHALN